MQIAYSEKGFKNVTGVMELRILRIGSTGEDVIKLQSTLITLGYKPGVNDGIFGVKTASAVIQLQKDNSLVPDGIVGPITWGYIQRLITATGVYIIQPGDTFYKIAIDNNITLSAIIAANPGVDPNMLMLGQAIQLPKPSVEPVPAPISILGFIPTDSVIDPAQPIIYMTDNPNRKLYGVNYQTKTIATIKLDLAPERLTYANGNLYVALLKSGHQYWTEAPLEGAIAVVDTKTFTLTKEFTIAADPYDIVVDHDGYIYTIPGSNQFANIDSFSPITNQKIASYGTMRYQSPAEMHPINNRIYSVDTDTSPRDMSFFDVSKGIVLSQKDSPYHGDYRMATNFRISPDGNYVFNGSGEIFDANLVHFSTLNMEFTDVAFDLSKNRFFLGNKAAKGITVFDYGTELNRVFTKLGSISTNGYVNTLFSQNNKLIALTKNESGQFMIEVLGSNF